MCSSPVIIFSIFCYQTSSGRYRSKLNICLLWCSTMWLCILSDVCYFEWTKKKERKLVNPTDKFHYMNNLCWELLIVGALQLLGIKLLVLSYLWRRLFMKVFEWSFISSKYISQRVRADIICKRFLLKIRLVLCIFSSDVCCYRNSWGKQRMSEQIKEKRN